MESLFLGFIVIFKIVHNSFISEKCNELNSHETIYYVLCCVDR